MGGSVIGGGNGISHARMSIVKIIELVGSSSESSDDAVRNALTEARQTLRNIKAVDVVSSASAAPNWTSGGPTSASPS